VTKLRDVSLPVAPSDAQSEIRALLAQIGGLVRMRDEQRGRGVTEADLDDLHAEIARLSWRLARRVHDGIDRGDAAA
jgi:hypothetical protein